MILGNMNRLKIICGIVVIILCIIGCTKEKRVPIYQHFWPIDSFSPNGDGLNEQFHIIKQPNVQLSSFNISIYNESLQLMYSSDNILNGWDGKYQGYDAPPGFYEYQVLYIASVDSVNYDDYITSSKVNLFR